MCIGLKFVYQSPCHSYSFTQSSTAFKLGQVPIDTLYMVRDSSSTAITVPE